MDQKLTQRIKSWLDTPQASRDINAGALMLLQLNSNRIMYNNIVLSPVKYTDILEHELQKYYNFRVQDITKAEVAELDAKVEKIVEVRHLNKEETSSVSSTIAETSNSLPNGEGRGEASSSLRKGKRADHDSLPDEIQALYVENLSILQKMRELHLKLRSLSTEDVTCPDSERYPFLKEIIRLDKQYHSNWEQYDHYVVSEGKVVTTPSTQDESLKALRLVNLYKGKYKKNPSEELKKVILENYAKIVSPSEKLTKQLQELGIL